MLINSMHLYRTSFYIYLQNDFPFTGLTRESTKRVVETIDTFCYFYRLL